MRKFLENVFAKKDDGEKAEPASQRNLQVATAALLVEVASIDDDFAPEEKNAIIDNMTAYFDLSKHDVEEIIAATHEELSRQLDLYYFAKQINSQFSRDDRIAIIEMVWRVIYSDDHLSGHEDHLAHRFARLLKLDHGELIAAKLRVKSEK